MATRRRPQHVVAELEATLEVLRKEWKRVEDENMRLKTRVTVLEAVIPVRNGPQRFRQPSPPSGPEVDAAILANLLQLADLGCMDPSPDSQPNFGTCSQPDASTCCTSEDSADSADAGERVGSPPSRPSPSPTGFYPGCSNRPTPTEAISGSSGGPQRSLGYCHLASTAAREAKWVDVYKNWLRDAALLVAAYDARPSEMYIKRIDEAFAKRKVDQDTLCISHPELISNMMVINLETGEEEAPPDNFWETVVQGLKLSPQQIAASRTALQLYREKMQVVLAERRTLAAQLDSCMGLLAREEAGGVAVPGSRRREQLTLEMDEVSSALDENVAAEGRTTALARDLLRSNIFSAMEVARISILSYPYFPDCLAVITSIANTQM
ncbi:hypothetical protein HYH03_000493 [Edaphochlamys debaryana]|uniref:Uncharacterized protein n=1 Tax=Edaphochlamys debaryana TaxID=47281 RepID=A0A835YHL3_9CHLO|nr:hypothetical protein HYH03_000493 [Edaphochlamys debaryana]|eukprot:KAG2501997.1 hypothetical protein HYH03_000493 [Edaphochlamys debaryana]